MPLCPAAGSFPISSFSEIVFQTKNFAPRPTPFLKGFLKGFAKGFVKGFVKGFLKGFVKGFVKGGVSGTLGEGRGE